MKQFWCTGNHPTATGQQWSQHHSLDTVCSQTPRNLSFTSRPWYSQTFLPQPDHHITYLATPPQNTTQCHSFSSHAHSTVTDQQWYTIWGWGGFYNTNLSTNSNRNTKPCMTGLLSIPFLPPGSNPKTCMFKHHDIHLRTDHADEGRQPWCHGKTGGVKHAKRRSHTADCSLFGTLEAAALPHSSTVPSSEDVEDLRAPYRNKHLNNQEHCFMETNTRQAFLRTGNRNDHTTTRTPRKCF